MQEKENILLVEPDFPYPNKSKNKANDVHKNFVPIGLLKIGAYYKDLGNNVKLVRGNKNKDDIGFEPNKIIITSLFTYWSKYVWESVSYYRTQFKDAEINIGGIYVTLHNSRKDFIANTHKYNVKCMIGLFEEAEHYLPDYSLLQGNVDHHVTHAMRGCIRRCKFCGTWKIEPKLTNKTANELVDEIKRIGKNKVIFFDNNFLANDNIKEILIELSKIKINNKSVFYESQSGFDGRLLEKNPEYAILLKKARFNNIKIAWDNALFDAKKIEKEITILSQAGYKTKDISIFMIYNYDVPYEDMLEKINYCKKWGIQIVDCRYRPLDSTFDNFNSHRKNQTNNDYHIHSKSGWTDIKVKDFRKRVRQHNIWIRYAKDKGLEYDKNMEKWSAIHSLYKFFNLGRPPRYDIIENNETLKSRISQLTKIKNYMHKQHLQAPNLQNYGEKELNNYLYEFFNNRINNIKD